MTAARGKAGERAAAGALEEVVVGCRTVAGEGAAAAECRAEDHAPK